MLVTSIPRSIETTLPGLMDNATINQRFGALIAEAGGIPVASDAWSDAELLAERVDAVVFNGGSDLAPSSYGAEPHPATDEPDLPRDRFELDLARAAIDRQLPILGVCRGMQVLNVALGGSLFQHLPEITDLQHYVVAPYDRPVHEIRIAADSTLASELGRTEASVNSVHHQAIDRLGEGLRATAWASDGTIEGVEDELGLLSGVQWHPEFMRTGRAEQVAVFRAALRRCLPAPGIR